MLASLDGVLEVAVIGTADERLGQRVVAGRRRRRHEGEARRSLPGLAACQVQAPARVPLRRRPSQERLWEDSPAGIREQLRGEERSSVSDVRRLSGRLHRRAWPRSRSTCPGKLNRVSMTARGAARSGSSPSSTRTRRSLRRAHGRRRRVHRRRRHRGLPAKVTLGRVPARDNVAAPERCSKPVIARSRGTSSASVSSSRSPVISGSPRTTSSSRCPRRRSG